MFPGLKKMVASITQQFLMAIGNRSANATFIASASSTSDTNSYTFSVNLGAANLYENIFVGIIGKHASNTVPTSVTVAGNACTSRASRSEGNTNADIWSLTYSAGGTQDIVVNWSINQTRMAIIVWGVTGLNSQVATDTAGSDLDPAEGAIDVSAGGMILVVAAQLTATTTTATGVTEDADFTVEANTTVFGGHLNSATAQSGLTVGCNFATGGSQIAMIAGAFR